MRTFINIIFIIFTMSLSLEAKLPNLNENDINKKIEEILQSHVTYKKLNPQIIQRSLNNFIDELDPGKVYFTIEDIQVWYHISDEQAQVTLKQFQAKKFSIFEQIHAAFVKSITRRQILEEQIKILPNDTYINIKDFYHLDWADNPEALLDRLTKIKTLQARTAEKLDGEIKEKFIKHIEKRRSFREEEIIGADHEKKQQLIYAYILKAVASSLDSQTAYFTPDEANGFMIQVQQRLFGIGVQLRDDFSGFMVVKIIEGGPADQKDNGLKVKDRIVAVNSEPVAGMDITEAVDLIRGKEGSPVILTVLRETGDEELEDIVEEKLDIQVMRGEVILKETRIESSYEPFGDGIIAHIKLFSFYQDPNNSSASDIAQKLYELSLQHKIKGVILDLRSNSGGVLPQAVAVTGLFISKGIVVSIKDNEGQLIHLRNIDPQKAWNGPLIVLINRASASASEIVAGSLQDYGRSLIIGDDYSYGKGTFQTFTLDTVRHEKANPKGEYKVTRGIYYTVSGKSPQLVGVQSDVIIPGFLSETQIGEKYAKYPLDNQHIKENFDDDLSDIPLYKREQVRRAYKFNLQPKTNFYTKHTPLLKKNSAARITQNKNYQNFLTELRDDSRDKEIIEVYGQNDLQLEESINVMKDLILIVN